MSAATIAAPARTPKPPAPVPAPADPVEPCTSSTAVGDALFSAYLFLNQASVVLDAAGSAMHRDAVWATVRLVGVATDLYFQVNEAPTMQKCEEFSQPIAEVEDLLKILCEWDDEARLLSAALTIVRLSQSSLQEAMSHLHAADRAAAADMQEMA